MERQGQTGQRGPPLEVDHFDRKISTRTKAFHLPLYRNPTYTAKEFFNVSTNTMHLYSGVILLLQPESFCCCCFFFLSYIFFFIWKSQGGQKLLFEQDSKTLMDSGNKMTSSCKMVFSFLLACFITFVKP